MHMVIEPSILYVGTPVVLISTLNEDGSANLAPMSSIWFLGWGCMIGLGSRSKTTENILREGECVLNLPSVGEVEAVNKLAMTTGSDPVPEHKLAKGYRHVADKFGCSGLNALPADLVRAPRIAECPLQLEAVLQARHAFGGSEPQREFGAALDAARLTAFELKIVRVHAQRDILLEGKANHIDADKWKPLIMSFARFYGLAEGEVLASRLAEVPEDMYRPAAHMGDARRAASV